jgi:hypothetical protein
VTECSICKIDYDNYGNNAAPFEGRCCDECNSRWVLPARIYGVRDPDTLKFLTVFAEQGRMWMEINTKARLEWAAHQAQAER